MCDVNPNPNLLEVLRYFQDLQLLSQIQELITVALLLVPDIDYLQAHDNNMI